MKPFCDVQMLFKSADCYDTGKLAQSKKILEIFLEEIETKFLINVNSPSIGLSKSFGYLRAEFLINMVCCKNYVH